MMRDEDDATALRTFTSRHGEFSVMMSNYQFDTCSQEIWMRISRTAQSHVHELALGCGGDLFGVLVAAPETGRKQPFKK